MASFPVRLEQSAPPPVAYFESLFDSFRKEVRDNDMNQPEVTKPTLPCSTQAPPPNPSPPPSQPPASTSTLPPNQNIVTCLECDPQTEALQSLSSVSPTLSKEMDKVISEEYDRKLGEKQRNLVIQVPPPTTPPPNSPPPNPSNPKIPPPNLLLHPLLLNLHPHRPNLPNLPDPRVRPPKNLPKRLPLHPSPQEPERLRLPPPTRTDLRVRGRILQGPQPLPRQSRLPQLPRRQVRQIERAGLGLVHLRLPPRTRS